MSQEESKSVGVVVTSDSMPPPPPPPSTANSSKELKGGGNTMEKPSSSPKSVEELQRENEKLRKELDALDQEIAAATQNHDMILDENALISLELQEFQRTAQQHKSKLEQELLKYLIENRGLMEKVSKLKGGLKELSQLMFEAIIQLNSNAIVDTPNMPALSHYPIASSSSQSQEVAIANQVQGNKERCEHPNENLNLRRCLESGPDSVQNQQNPEKVTLAIASTIPPPQESVASFRKRLLHSVDTNRENEGFYCICGASLSSKQSLKTHIQYFTYKFQFACTACPKRFFATSLLRAHMKNTHGMQLSEKGNGCRRCGTMFPTRMQLYWHYKTVHNSGPMVFHTKRGRPAANSSTPKTSAPPSSSTSRNHYVGNLHAFKIPHGLDTSKTGMPPGDTSVHCVCGRRFKTDQYLQMHIKHYSKEPKHQCQFCDKLYYKAFRLNAHMKSSHAHQNSPQLARSGTVAGSQQCKKCGIVFKTRMAFNQHVKKMHNQKPEVAKDTPPPSSWPLACVEPLSTPKRQRKAPLKYQDQDYLSKHTTTHSCPVSTCRRTFYRKDHLKRHLTQVHKPSANESRPVPMSRKKKKPAEEKRDERHGVSVLNVKYEEFQCLCGKQFSRQSSLRDHIRLKRGLISFSCPVCKQSFNRHDYLKKHMQRFHNLNAEGTMGCNLCGMGGFQERNELNKHKMKYHKNATEEDPLLLE